MNALPEITLSDIEGARPRIRGLAVRTPLIRLDVGDREVWLKLECLQPIGSFKIRGAANALALAGPGELDGGVYTASAGNMAQGVALAARVMDVACRVIVPDTAPRTKVEAIARLGARTIAIPWTEWWDVIRNHGRPGDEGYFVHPVADPAVIAGNGTVGLEILEDLPEVDTVFVPYGGGGLSTGIAAALAARRPEARVYAAEVETAAPLAASIAAGRAVHIDRDPTFVDGIGGASVLEEMWPLASALLHGSSVRSLEEVCDAIRLLATGAHVVGEGAAGAAVAAAIARASDPATRGERIVAVVSGGNIDTNVLATILEGGIPGV